MSLRNFAALTALTIGSLVSYAGLNVSATQPLISPAEVIPNYNSENLDRDTKEKVILTACIIKYNHGVYFKTKLEDLADAKDIEFERMSSDFEKLKFLDLQGALFYSREENSLVFLYESQGQLIVPGKWKKKVALEDGSFGPASDLTEREARKYIARCLLPELLAEREQCKK